MKTLGIDLNTRQLDLVLVDDDTGRATYHPCPFVSHKPPFRFTDTRNVRPRLNEVIAASSRDGWDGIYLLGVEKPYSQNTDNAYKYGLVTGAILATVPRHVCVLELPPQEWKALTVGRASASKGDVHEWGILQLQAVGVWREEHRAWPQDAWDALALAHAARALNAKAVAA